MDVAVFMKSFVLRIQYSVCYTEHRTAKTLRFAPLFLISPPIVCVRIAGGATLVRHINRIVDVVDTQLPWFHWRH